MTIFTHLINRLRLEGKSRHSKRVLARGVACLVLAVFLGQQITIASPSPRTLKLEPTQKSPLGFHLPESVATVDEVHIAPDSTKQIYLIQDAHTNPSGQIHLAQALEQILKHEGIRHVFTEAGVGDDGLDFIKNVGTPQARQQVGLAYLRKGLIKGTEYLSFTSDEDFVLWGVEDEALYDQSLVLYRHMVQKRAANEYYLAKAKRTSQFLNTHLLNPALSALLLAKKNYDAGEMFFKDYLERLWIEARKEGYALTAYPQLARMHRLMRLEAKLDFKQVSTDVALALTTISAESRAFYSNFQTVQGSRHHRELAAQRAYYLSLAEQFGDLSPYPHLRQYVAYLKQIDIPIKQVMREMAELEEKIIQLLTSSPEESQLTAVSSKLQVLDSLLDLKLIPSDYTQLAHARTSYTMDALGGILNQKIMSLEREYGKAVILNEVFDQSFEEALRFYELARERDYVFVERMLAKMREGNESKAVLVTGGFHTPHIQEILEARHISYVTIMPQVLHATDHERYERILLNQDQSALMTFDKAVRGVDTVLALAQDVSERSKLSEANHQLYMNQTRRAVTEQSLAREAYRQQLASSGSRTWRLIQSHVAVRADHDKVAFMTAFLDELHILHYESMRGPGSFNRDRLEEFMQFIQSHLQLLEGRAHLAQEQPVSVEFLAQLYQALADAAVADESFRELAAYMREGRFSDSTFENLSDLLDLTFFQASGQAQRDPEQSAAVIAYLRESVYDVVVTRSTPRDLEDWMAGHWISTDPRGKAHRHHARGSRTNPLWGMIQQTIRNRRGDQVLYLEDLQQLLTTDELAPLVRRVNAADVADVADQETYRVEINNRHYGFSFRSLAGDPDIPYLHVREVNQENTAIDETVRRFYATGESMSARPEELSGYRQPAQAQELLESMQTRLVQLADAQTKQPPRRYQQGRKAVARAQLERRVLATRLEMAREWLLDEADLNAETAALAAELVRLSNIMWTMTDTQRMPTTKIHYQAEVKRYLHEQGAISEFIEDLMQAYVAAGQQMNHQKTLYRQRMQMFVGNVTEVHGAAVQRSVASPASGAESLVHICKNLLEQVQALPRAWLAPSDPNDLFQVRLWLERWMPEMARVDEVVALYDEVLERQAQAAREAEQAAALLSQADAFLLQATSETRMRALRLLEGIDRAVRTEVSDPIYVVNYKDASAYIGNLTLSAFSQSERRARVSGTASLAERIMLEVEAIMSLTEPSDTSPLYEQWHLAERLRARNIEGVRIEPAKILKRRPGSRLMIQAWYRQLQAEMDAALALFIPGSTGDFMVDPNEEYTEYSDASNSVNAFASDLGAFRQNIRTRWLQTDRVYASLNDPARFVPESVEAVLINGAYGRLIDELDATIEYFAHYLFSAEVYQGDRFLLEKHASGHGFGPETTTHAFFEHLRSAQRLVEFIRLETQLLKDIAGLLQETPHRGVESALLKLLQDLGGENPPLPKQVEQRLGVTQLQMQVFYESITMDQSIVREYNSIYQNLRSPVRLGSRTSSMYRFIVANDVPTAVADQVFQEFETHTSSELAQAVMLTWLGNSRVTQAWQNAWLTQIDAALDVSQQVNYHHLAHTLFLPDHPEYQPVPPELFIQGRTLEFYPDHSEGAAPIERVEIEAQDNPAFHGYLYKPVSVGSEPQALTILFHGITSSKEFVYFNPLIKELIQTRAVLVTDLPGHGENQGTLEDQASVYDYVADIVRFVDARPDLDAKRLSALGFSLGGVFAVRAGLHPKYGDRFNSVVTLNSPTQPFFRNFRSSERRKQPVEPFFSRMFRGIDTTQSFLDAMHDFAISDEEFSQLEVIAEKFQLIHGSEDSTVAPDFRMLRSATADKADIVVLKGERHYSSGEAKARWAEAAHQHIRLFDVAGSRLASITQALLELRDRVRRTETKFKTDLERVKEDYAPDYTDDLEDEYWAIDEGATEIYHEFEALIASLVYVLLDEDNRGQAAELSDVTKTYDEIDRKFESLILELSDTLSEFSQEGFGFKSYALPVLADFLDEIRRMHDTLKMIVGLVPQIEPIDHSQARRSEVQYANVLQVLANAHRHLTRAATESIKVGDESRLQDTDEDDIEEVWQELDRKEQLILQNMAPASSALGRAVIAYQAQWMSQDQLLERVQLLEDEVRRLSSDVFEGRNLEGRPVNIRLSNILTDLQYGRYLGDMQRVNVSLSQAVGLLGLDADDELEFDYVERHREWARMMTSIRDLWSDFRNSVFLPLKVEMDLVGMADRAEFTIGDAIDAALDDAYDYYDPRPSLTQARSAILDFPGDLRLLNRRELQTELKPVYAALESLAAQSEAIIASVDAWREDYPAWDQMLVGARNQIALRDHEGFESLVVGVLDSNLAREDSAIRVPLVGVARPRTYYLSQGNVNGKPFYMARRSGASKRFDAPEIRAIRAETRKRAKERNLLRKQERAKVQALTRSYQGSLEDITRWLASDLEQAKRYRIQATFNLTELKVFEGDTVQMSQVLQDLVANLAQAKQIAKTKGIQARVELENFSTLQVSHQLLLRRLLRRYVNFNQEFAFVGEITSREGWVQSRLTTVAQGHAQDGTVYASLEISGSRLSRLAHSLVALWGLVGNLGPAVMVTPEGLKIDATLAAPEMISESSIRTAEFLSDVNTSADEVLRAAQGQALWLKKLTTRALVPLSDFLTHMWKLATDALSQSA